MQAYVQRGERYNNYMPIFVVVVDLTNYACSGMAAVSTYFKITS